MLGLGPGRVQVHARPSKPILGQCEPIHAILARTRFIGKDSVLIVEGADLPLWHVLSPVMLLGGGPPLWLAPEPAVRAGSVGASEEVLATFAPLVTPVQILEVLPKLSHRWHGVPPLPSGCRRPSCPPMAPHCHVNVS